MSLPSGTRLGPYDILAPLGAGGMGEVYRATDSHLKRSVAIKVLPASVAGDADRLARFQREAEVLAALNHPNIAQIYGLEKTSDVTALVMELVEGDDLSQRIARSAIPIDDALPIAKQIAEALEAAHERGIIHRDLKPANVKVRADGTVKVLDFGLAKAMDPIGAAEATPFTAANSPTMTSPAMTAMGMIVGTAAYMSPEQARGRPVDRRADIWSFGVVLFEMLTGRRLFASANHEGESVSDVLAAVLRADIDLAALPAHTPRAVTRLVERCLDRNTRTRLRDIGEARVAIEAAARADDETPTGDPAAREASGSGAGVRPGLLAVASVALIAATALATWSLTGSGAAGSGPIHLQLGLGPGIHLFGNATADRFERPSRSALAISTDGQLVVFAATDGDTSRLYTRRLDEPHALAIAGTEGGSIPLLSSDGESVAFIAAGELKRVPLRGGSVRTLLSGVDSTRGGQWADDGNIYFDGPNGIIRVGANGGVPNQMTEVQADRNESAHLHPWLLPDARAMLYTVQRGVRNWREAEIWVQPFGGAPKMLVRDGADARYVATGHLVFLRWGTLMAVPFDAAALEVTGEPVRVLEDVMHAVNGVNTDSETGGGQLAISASGTLAYAPGGISPAPTYQPMWVWPEPRTPILEPRSTFPYPRLSPDGGRLSLRVGDLSDGDIEIVDLASGAVAHLDLPGSQVVGGWSPDGTRVTFSSRHESPVSNLYIIGADLAGAPERLTTSDTSQTVSDWSVDDVLVFVSDNRDIEVLDLRGDRQVRPFVAEQSASHWPSFSPDGRWIAYAGDRQGSFDIYVRPYPQRDPVYRVTRGGGTRPVWSKDGRRLYYRGDRGTMAVDVTTGGGHITFSPPRLLFERLYADTTPTRSYDVSADGRFVMVEATSPEPTPVTHVNVVLNWFEILTRLVSEGR